MKKFLTVVIIGITLFALIGCSNNEQPCLCNEENQMQNVATLEEFFEAMQSRLELTEIEKDLNHPIITPFSGGIRFKYRDTFFELYQVKDPQFRLMVWYIGDKYSTNMADLMTNGVSFTDLNFVSSFGHNEEFVLLRQGAWGEEVDLTFARDYRHLIFTFHDITVGL